MSGDSTGPGGDLMAKKSVFLVRAKQATEPPKKNYAQHLVISSGKRAFDLPSGEVSSTTVFSYARLCRWTAMGVNGA